jgi:tetratricopeptide (TPR) repeat protein
MKQVAWPLAIFVAAVLAFQPALRNRFTFDDVPLVGERAAPRGIGGWLATAAEPWWPSDHDNFVWRPLTRLTIEAQRMIMPEGVRWPLYAVNILLHAAVALALWALARRLGLGHWAAGAAGLLFAAHPVHSEAVHQIVGRAELLAALFMLLGLRALWTDGLGSRRAFAMQMVWLALAVTSKEHAIIYPGLAALVLWARRGPHLSAGRRELAGTRAWALIGALTLAVALFFAGKAAVTSGLLEPVARVRFHENPLAGMSPRARLPAVLGIFELALTRCFWPFGLSPDYSYRSLPYEAGWGWWRGGAGLALLIGIVAWGARNARRGGSGWLIALGGVASYALTSNGPFVIGVVTAERLWYWPSAFVLLGTGWALGRARARLPEARRRTLTLGVALAAIGLLAGCWNYAAAWRSTYEHAEWTLARFPDSWRGHANLSREAYFNKDFQTGYEHARAAIAILEIEDGFEWDLLGMNATFLDGREAEAEDAFRRALEINPTLNEVHRHWANLLESRGRHAEAAAQLRAYLAGPDAKDREAVEQRIKRLE